MTPVRTPTSRRAAAGLGLAAVATAALFLAPVDDQTAGHAVTRIPSGVAVGAQTTPPAPAPTPAPAPKPALVAPSAPVPPWAPAPAPPWAPAPVPPWAPAPAPGPPAGSARTSPGTAPAAGGPASRHPPAALAPEPPAADGQPSPGPAGGVTPAPAHTAAPAPAQPPVDPCPAPPRGAVPPASATAQVGAPPEPGAYEYLLHPAGAAALRPDPERWIVAASAPGAWELTIPLDGGWSTTSALRVRANAIELTAWTLRHGDRSWTVRPVLAVRDLALPASPGTAWDETRHDLSARAAIRTTGRYLERQTVPLCGAVVDTWKVETTLAITPLPLLGSEVPTVTLTATRWVATQHGALIARAAKRIEVLGPSGAMEQEGTWHLKALQPR